MYNSIIIRSSNNEDEAGHPFDQMAEQFREGSQKFESFAGATERPSQPGNRETFHSCNQDANASFKSSTNSLNEEEIHMAATHVAAQQRSYFVSMMTGVSTCQRPTS